jgi:hypothetical protein
MASFMSPSFLQARRGPAGKGQRAATPGKAPGSVARLSLLGAAQECSIGVLHESYSQLCRQVPNPPFPFPVFPNTSLLLSTLQKDTFNREATESLIKVGLAI